MEADDLITDSVFEEQRVEKGSLFENMKAMPTHLGARDEDEYYDYQYADNSTEEICGIHYWDYYKKP